MISVVIPVYNEAKYIARTLSSIKNQKHNDLEIIVVDGRSTDETVRIARKYALVVQQTKKGIANARNTGAKMAKGKILYFVDGDTEVKMGVLDELEKIFKNKGVSVVSGPIEPLERVGILVKFVFKVGSLSSRLSALIHIPLFTGSNIAVRASVFSKVGGFDESFVTAEDIDFSKGAGRFGKTVFSSKIRVMSSARRVLERGIFRFSLFTVYNFLRFLILGRPVRVYSHING